MVDLLLRHNRFVRCSSLWHFQIFSGVFGQELLLLGHVSDCAYIREAASNYRLRILLLGHTVQPNLNPESVKRL